MLPIPFRLANLNGQREGRVVRHSRNSGNPVLNDVELLYQPGLAPTTYPLFRLVSCTKKSIKFRSAV